jgi:hypothetical protein
VREHASGNLMRAGLTVLSVYDTNRYIFAGLTTDTATDAVAAWLEARGLGAKKVNYKLRDWLFARQVCWMTTILLSATLEDALMANALAPTHSVTGVNRSQSCSRMEATRLCPCARVRATPQAPRFTFTSGLLSPPVSFLAEDLPVILPPTDNFR